MSKKQLKLISTEHVLSGRTRQSDGNKINDNHSKLSIVFQQLRIRSNC